MSDFNPVRLVKSIASDLAALAVHVYGYLYWNAKGVRITPECRVHPKARIAPSASFFGSTYVHDRAYIGHFTYGTNCIIDNAIVGKFCSLGPGCLLGPNDHPLTSVSTHPATYDAATYNRMIQPAVIGDDVWIGSYAVVLAGVKVASGSVVAATAVVTDDVEPFSIVGGVPARVIGRRPANNEFINAIAATEDLEELRALAGKARQGSNSFRHENYP